MRARLAVICLAGCGRIGFGDLPPSDAAPPPVVVGVLDGSRLHAERWVTSDGVAQLAHWYDTQLGTECDWNGTIDARCLPTLAADVFGDPACTKTAVRGPPTDCAPKYATLGKTVYDVGDVVATAFTSVNGACQPVTAGGVYYLLGAAVPIDSFVHGTTMETAVGDGLSTLDVVGDDGSRQRYDLAYTGGMPCDVVETGATTGVCLPRSGILIDDYARSYSDPACTKEAIENDVGSTFATVTYAAEPCVVRGVALGAQLAATTIYVRDTTGACVPRATPPAAMFPVTDAAPQFPALTAVDAAVGSRVRARAWRSPGGALLSRGLYDAELGANCVPRASGDRAYCMPFGTQGQPAAFPTANCTGNPVTLQVACEGLHLLPSADGIGCNGPTVTFSRNDTTQLAPPFSVSDFGTCVPVDTTGFTVSTLGALVPFDPSTLAELSLAHD